jgi:hypothetical protein
LRIDNLLEVGGKTSAPEDSKTYSSRRATAGRRMFGARVQACVRESKAAYCGRKLEQFVSMMGDGRGVELLPRMKRSLNSSS